MDKSSLIPFHTPTLRPARDRFGSWNTVSSQLSVDEMELEPLTQVSPVAGLDEESDSAEEDLSDANELLTLSSAVSIVLSSELGEKNHPAVLVAR